MKAFDWAILFTWLAVLVGYGLYRGRGSSSVDKFLRGGKTMPWYAMGLSIVATQASAITFISTTGQGYIDGLRFAQFYFGLPLAMLVISAVAVPVFHRANVYTAYEYLERRFDAKVRALVSLIFLIQRGLAAGIGLYAPAVALAAVLGWSDRWTTVLIGALVITYTASGGIKALTWADVLQMSMIMVVLLVSLFIAIHALPSDISFRDALHLAGASGRLKVVDTKFDWSNRYNLWSGLIGGGFLALAYFGCDQSQVQRYLTGRSIAQSRLGLLFNAIVKIPMQVLILFIGAMVFVVSLFVVSPSIFEPNAAQLAAQSPHWKAEQRLYSSAFEERRKAAYDFASKSGSASSVAQGLTALRNAQSKFDAARARTLQLAATMTHSARFDDTNYIFLSFITRFLPAGLVGLTIGVIFSASMGSTSGEINSLATVSAIDIYRRYIVRNASDRHYLLVSRFLTIFWGTYAICFAAFGARGFGALIERVNIVGSLFYGSMLGVFVLAFALPHVRGTAAFLGAIAGQITILAIAVGTTTSFLWYNVIGSLVVVGVAVGYEFITHARSRA